MTVWILIIIHMHGPAMQEFTSKERCEAAGNVLQAYRAIDYFCVEK